MAKSTLPHPSVPVVDPATGKMDMDWYSYFKERERVRLIDLPDVDATGTTNGQVLAFNSTTLKWTPVAN